MKIKTQYDPPPIPVRYFDWSAWDDATLDEGSIFGYGTTEAEAVQDLMIKITEKANG